jgi:hypothetical protein
LLGSNPGKGRLSESQLLLVVQHRGSLCQVKELLVHRRGSLWVWNFINQRL